MRIKLTEPIEIRIYGLDRRDINRLAWCALTYGISRLFWVDGLLMCLEVYERSVKYEIEKRVFPISHLCYTNMDKYIKTLEIRKGAEIPVVDVSDVKVFKKIAEFVRNHEKS
ncbi:hypothetical protein DRN86_00875 [Candidatus Geothermarchaeota archaeon]|nr:MAG: hypothetical protein DRN86_00875 [Candidatus Geothermarchaeota archaeon]